MKADQQLREAGDFRDVVAQHQAAVRGFLRTRLGDPGRADELTQEVFLRAWRSADQYDSTRSTVRVWLLGIARNLVIDSYRADAARPRSVGSDDLLLTVPAADAFDAAVSALSMAESLKQLTPAHRDVLVCLYYRRWTLAETADHLGVAVGTVKSRSTYALRALRLVLNEREAP